MSRASPWLLALCLSLSACNGCSSSAAKVTGDGGQPAGTGPDGGGGGDGGPPGDGGTSITGTLEIRPASVTLSIEGTTGATTHLTAVVVSDGGQSQQVSARWTSSDIGLASVDGTGLVTAPGPRGGPVTIVASAENQTATAQVTIYSQQQSISGNGADAGSSLFTPTPVTDPVKSPALIYPYNATVIPVNLQPLNFQWTAGAGNNLFRVTLTGPYGVLTAYVSPPTASQPNWQPDQDMWSAFAQSNLGQTVTVDLAGVNTNAPGTVYGAPTQSLTFAASRFAGTIYYWTVTSPGQVLRVSANSSAPEPVFSPPSPYPGAPGDASQCMGCHSVSRDGTHLSTQLWASDVSKAGTVLDLTQITSFPDGGFTPAGVTVDAGYWSWRFSTFDNTGDFLVTSWNGALTLRNANTGVPLPIGSPENNLGNIGCGGGSTCTHPSWSPNGDLLFYALGKPSHFQYDVDFQEADLMAAPWDAGGQTFSTPMTFVPYNYDGQPLANFHPTVSIDGQLVVFNRGPCSRSDGTDCSLSWCDGGSNTSTCMPASLRLVSIDGGIPVELVNAESPDTRNWFPNFSPFKEGGYHWLAFFSERNYGWVTAGKNQRQLWVTAIDDNPNGTSDPSHPAFWLPGQITTTDNDKAEWAPLPCAGDGGACQGDIDCCNGLVCRLQAGSTDSTCIPQTQACVYSGGGCGSVSDCCTGLTCINNLCIPPPT